MSEPTAQNTIMNVDRSDEDDEILAPEKQKTSIFERFKLFGRKRGVEETSMAEQDPFFKALHNSFQGEQEQNEPSFGGGFEQESPEPHWGPSPSFATLDKQEKPLTADRDFMQGFSDHISAAVDNDIQQMATTDTQQAISANDFAASLAAVRNEALQTAESAKPIEVAIEKKTSAEPDDENLVYPFGGWTDENNYAK